MPPELLVINNGKKEEEEEHGAPLPDAPPPAAANSSSVESSSENKPLSTSSSPSDGEVVENDRQHQEEEEEEQVVVEKEEEYGIIIDDYDVDDDDDDKLLPKQKKNEEDDDDDAGDEQHLKEIETTTKETETTATNSNNSSSNKNTEETTPSTTLQASSDVNDNDLLMTGQSHTLFGSRVARHMARRPWFYFVIAWIFALTLSVVGFTVGEFEISVDNLGWQSRGTLISNRHTQLGIVGTNVNALSNANNNDEIWDELINNVQPGWETEDVDVQTEIQKRRQLQQQQSVFLSQPHPSDEEGLFSSWASSITNNNWWRRRSTKQQQRNNPYQDVRVHHQQQQYNRLLQAGGGLGSIPAALEGCDYTWYTSDRMIYDEHLWPIWRTRENSISALDSQVITDICQAEHITQTVLEEQGLCSYYQCTTTTNSSGTTDPTYRSDAGFSASPEKMKCLPPYSLVLLARVVVGDSDFTMSCADLGTAWAEVREQVEVQLLKCVADIHENIASWTEELPDSCPLGFSPVLVDEAFGVPDASTGEINTKVRYTSTIFATNEYDYDALYDHVDAYDRATGSEVVQGYYDTQYEAFNFILVDSAVGSDMTLAAASAIVTSLAILIHTRSVWITVIGLFQIVLSFPLAYFLYTLVIRLNFFPFLNFIGVFVVFALGADDIFVASDKWKNARLDHPTATTEQIAAIALPDAALAMFLTTITTAVAFFGTAICPVAPLRMFAVFNGLLILWDYIMCILLVFPALCLYDKWLLRGNCCCVSCHCCHRFETEGGHDADGEEQKPSLIRRILSNYYDLLHFSRFGLLVAIAAAIVLTGITASNLGLPDSSDVRLLDGDHEFEKSFEYRLELLSTAILKESGSVAFVIWGVTPADTGNHNDPGTWSQLVLDESFDASSEAAQQYLNGFCDSFFGEEFAEPFREGFNCPVTAFDEWLQWESNRTDPSAPYVDNCDGATSLPMPQTTFDQCIIAWTQYVGQSRRVLQRDGRVQIIMFPYKSRVQWDSPFDELDSEWHLVEDWMKRERGLAPDGVNRMYSSSEDYWWYDTNLSMQKTAFGSGGIALAAAATVMIFSSRSFELSFFALFTIGFILLSVTSMLVAAGWTLGFLESICFAILIGVSCDFVIHFAHSYSFLKGEHSRHDRSKHALLRMGPSILAAAFTTISSAVVMLFTVISFFQKFAMILFFTILMATVGSFIVFLTLTDTFGPAHPTVLVDSIVDKATGCFRKEDRKLLKQDEGERVVLDLPEDISPGKQKSAPLELQAITSFGELTA